MFESDFHRFEDQTQTMIPPVLIDKNEDQSPAWFHTVEHDGYMTLYVTSNVDVQVGPNEKLVIHIGHRDQTHVFSLGLDDCILKNMPVYCGEECWARVSSPNKYYVHGFVVRQPVS